LGAGEKGANMVWAFLGGGDHDELGSEARAYR
jgi:hypothetical protein